MIKDTILASSIQEELDKGPKNPQNLPIFRLVWSEDLFEKRLGTFRDYDGDTFIRERIEVENTKKYNFINNRWIFEQWFPPEVAFNSELVESNKGDYICIYVFEEKNGQPLPLNLTVIQFLVHECLKPKTSEQFKKSYSITIEEEKRKRAFDKDIDMLGDEGPLVSQFHDGSAILMPGKDF